MKANTAPFLNLAFPFLPSMPRHPVHELLQPSSLVSFRAILVSQNAHKTKRHQFRNNSHGRQGIHVGATQPLRRGNG